jgi:hypothetical protein
MPPPLERYQEPRGSPLVHFLASCYPERYPSFADLGVLESKFLILLVSPLGMSPAMYFKGLC